MLTALLNYLTAFMQYRLAMYFEQEVQEPVMPVWEMDSSPFSQFLQANTLSKDEILTLGLALVSHVYPNRINEVIRGALPNVGDFPEFGGVKGTNHRGILPTGETAVFLLAADDLAKRIEVQRLFSTQHFFYKKRILWLETMKEGEPEMAGRIILDSESIQAFLYGNVAPPKFSTEFPAEYITTSMEWKDLILPEVTMKSIDDIKTWVQHKDVLMNEWGLSQQVKPGYRALFHGPPGTGKTLTALLIGKHTGKDVFRIDLSMMVSKYIGETEKNLSRLFDKAQNKDWVLFFDEADALFGKRTGVRDAHDKYANQEVSYLLQRVESYPGLVVLASNFKSNIDDAFMRRFQSVIYFPMPKAEERVLLWKNAIPKNVTLESSINIEGLATKYELSGSLIVNVVHYACLQAISRNTTELSLSDILEGIRRELTKEGKLI